MDTKIGIVSEFININYKGTTYYKAKQWYYLETNPTRGFYSTSVTSKKLIDKLNEMWALRML